MTSLHRVPAVCEADSSAAPNIGAEPLLVSAWERMRVMSLCRCSQCLYSPTPSSDESLLRRAVYDVTLWAYTPPTFAFTASWRVALRQSHHFRSVGAGPVSCRMKTGSRMWHEARKHERKLRGMMVDYKKRAERRREYYEKIVFREGYRVSSHTCIPTMRTMSTACTATPYPHRSLSRTMILAHKRAQKSGPGSVPHPLAYQSLSVGGDEDVQLHGRLIPSGLQKKDPAQFLQVHGRFCKIHLDSAVALAAESPVNMMPWQGDPNNMIDRFDVRAHLDYIPEYKPPLLTTISPEQEADDRKCNYERYRGLVQNDFAGISEEQCLYQIYIDELYGGLQRPGDDEKKRLAEKKASIGYTYDDSTVADLGSSDKEDEDSDDESKSDEDEVIPDIDVEVDVDDITEEQVADLNKQATTYGMAEGDFVRMLRKDKEESEAIKHAKALEEEKAMYSGRRSRRQRREFREKRLKGRKISPPSYARRDSPTYDPYRRSQSETSSASRSRSPSQGREEAITFITSFGGSEDESASGPAAQTPATSGNKRAPHSQAPGTSSGRKEASRSEATLIDNQFHMLLCKWNKQMEIIGNYQDTRRRSSSSSSSSSSTTSSSSRTTSRSRSRSRSSSRSRRDSRRRRSTSRSRSRWYSRSPARRYSGGGGIRDSRKYSRSRSPDRDRYYGGRRRSRSRSRSLDRYGRGGKTSGRSQESSQSSISRSPSPNREKGARRTISPAVGERLKRPELAVSRESGAAKVSKNSTALLIDAGCGVVAKLTPQEKLKLRMQKALNKQYKADKKAAQEKIIQQEHERQEREDELRAMARKIRMKERERRERERDEWERHYTRSRSPSPRHMQAAGSGSKDAMQEGPAMTSRSCDRNVITGPVLIPTLGPEAAACTAHRRQDYKGPSDGRDYSSSKRRSRSRSRSPHHRH
ncbi:unnamed protein product [Ranitomeya imitator]|uniref:Suppressor of white apricot N-terminal domain-containing protein n=1 Tax=Ranitomeya imitator TaxID=111125 RepID=A0ABN9M0N6_9NEOB|nr:unnamed protein product [Ranitomeya imitator]